jgi:hypothetical protein
VLLYIGLGAVGFTPLVITGRFVWQHDCCSAVLGFLITHGAHLMAQMHGVSLLHVCF